MGEFRVKRGSDASAGDVRHYFPGRSADWSACGEVTRSESREVTMLDGFAVCADCLPSLVHIWREELEE